MEAEKIMGEALRRAREAIKVENYGLARRDLEMVLRIIGQEIEAKRGRVRRGSKV